MDVNAAVGVLLFDVRVDGDCVCGRNLVDLLDTSIAMAQGLEEVVQAVDCTIDVTDERCQSAEHEHSGEAHSRLDAAPKAGITIAAFSCIGVKQIWVYIDLPCFAAELLG